MVAETAVREKPILFSGEMVKAILAGQKVMTRRVVKPQPVGGDVIVHDKYMPGFVCGRVRDSENAWRDCRCPYEVGMNLWVRETFFLRHAGKSAVYRADLGTIEAAGVGAMYGGWKPSIFMPRWASRITLQVERVRAERLLDISGADALDEGVQPGTHTHAFGLKPTYTGGFLTLWDKLNEPRGFGVEQNPWVWVIEFKTVRQADECRHSLKSTTTI